MTKGYNLDHQPLLSAIEGVTFPAIFGKPAEPLLGLMFQLEQSQWWSQDRMRAQQFRQLHLLLQHAKKTTPHYSKLLSSFSIPSNPSELEKSWRQIPILQRQDIQTQNANLVSKSIPKSHGQVGSSRTSGSSGQPIQVTNTRLGRRFWGAFTLRDHLWHRRDFAKKLGHIRTTGKNKAEFPKGVRANSWGRTSSALFKTGASMGLNINTPVADQVAWLLREDPEYLLTYPNIAKRMARYCLEKSLKPKRLLQI